MRSVRTKITVLTLVGALALAGCARPTEEALRVGDVSVDNAQIDDVVSGILSQLGDNRVGVADSVAGLLQFAAQLTAFTEVARRYAREQGVTVPTPNYTGAATELQLDTDDPLARRYAEAIAHRDALLEDATARTPTEDEMHAVYDDFVALVGEGQATYDQIRNELLSWEAYGQALTLRDELVEAAQRYGVSVHPRYQPLDFPLLRAGQSGELTVVSLPLGEQGTGAIRPES